MHTGCRYHTMKYKSTTFLIIALAIVVNNGSSVTADDDDLVDLVAEEAKNRAVTIIEGPKNLTRPSTVTPTVKPDVQTNLPVPAAQPDVQTHWPDHRPPSKPPIIPDKLMQSYIDLNRPFFTGQIQKMPAPRPYYQTPMKLPQTANSLFQFPTRVVQLPPNKNYYIKQSKPLQYVASTYAPTVTKTPPKFSVPVQTINGIRTDFVRPPKYVLNTTSTTTTTTTETTTTAKVLRTKRIWPKKDKQKTNTTEDGFLNGDWTKTNSTDGEKEGSESRHRVRYVERGPTTTPGPTTKRSYRPVTRVPKKKPTTLAPSNFTHIEPNDWVPIMPSHYRKDSNRHAAPTNVGFVKRRVRRSDTGPISRSDVGQLKKSDLYPVRPTSIYPVRPTSIYPARSFTSEAYSPSEASSDKNVMYLQSFGLLPINPDMNPIKKKMVLYKPKRHVNPYNSQYSTISGYKPKHVMHSPIQSAAMPIHLYEDLQPEESHAPPRVVTKVKHHHHHHHHRYIKTVEKPVKVPVNVEVPKPYAVAIPVEKQVPVPVEKIKIVEKRVPYPVHVEKRVPYPIGIKIPHPVPVKVVEKEYVPKPYPIVHHVPVVKHVQVKVPHPVPVTVEKKVPYPVEVQVPVPVDRPVPVQVEVEKRVPYPVPVRVLVPQPYPVEKRVPYPVEKEVEIIKHVPFRVPVPQPYPVKVPHPVPVQVEKRVPYPVHVEKKVPVPVEVYVPQRIEVEKKVPVYVPKPYPVEKKVPYPVKVPVPVKVPFPVQVPIYIHDPYTTYEESPAVSYSHQSNGVTDSSVQHSVTVHGNDYGFQSRSDDTNTEATNTNAATTTTESTTST